MGPANFAPVDTEFVAQLVGNFGLGDKSNLLSKVKVNFVLAVNSFNFDQTNTVVLGPKTTLEAEEGTVNMKARRS
jgi:hypothetical protein